MAEWSSTLDWDANQSESNVSHPSGSLKLASASSGTVPNLHYSFSQTSGTTITDETGHGNDGTVNGSPDLTASGIESTSGIEFVGNAGDNIEMGDIINENSGTFTFWLNMQRHFDFNSIIDNAVSNNDWESWVDGDSQTINWRPGSTKLDNASVILSTGAWYHIGFTWEEGNTAEVYIDATLEDSVSAPSSFDPASTVYIGQGNSGNDPSEHKIDEFRWYDKRLSGSEIQDDMDRGTSQASGGSFVTSGSLTTANGVIK